ncbi:MAG: phosphoribosylglycinamide formyltransferase [Patescibacteria group bacterium]|jgi:phosphoribosylglycinamide formyltransferase-1|nr:phosphoribosylglycinamide formyltransferase [Patescibacteria group bacterium]
MSISQRNHCRVAALIGRGGRLKAIYECCKNHPLIELAVVISHKKESPGIEWAKTQGIEAFYFRLSDWKLQGKDRQLFDEELAKILKERNINLVVMAGWDLVVSQAFLKNFPNAVINIHPSLCPSFPGLDAPKQALDYGVKITGCTLHFVDEGVDTGPIIFQRAVEVKNDDTIESLEEKIHQKEEEILCEGIKAFAEGRIKIDGRKVIVL